MVKLVLIGEQSDLARAAYDFAAAQNPPFYGLERGLAAEHYHSDSTCGVLGILLQTCLPSFLKDSKDLKSPD